MKRRNVFKSMIVLAVAPVSIKLDMLSSINNYSGLIGNYHGINWIITGAQTDFNTVTINGMKRSLDKMSGKKMTAFVHPKIYKDLKVGDLVKIKG